MNNRDNGKIISVFGGSRIQRHDKAWQEAVEAGRLLAEAGFTVANGGYGGLMEAVSEGARLAQGHVIGVTCTIFDGQRTGANPYVTREVQTATLAERMQRLAALADGYLVLRGSVGTLAELTYVWSLFLAGEVKPRPLILLGEDYERMLAALCETTALGQKEMRWVQVAATPSEAVERLCTSLLR